MNSLGNKAATGEDNILTLIHELFTTGDPRKKRAFLATKLKKAPRERGAL
jgi:hypothetical protein